MPLWLGVDSALIPLWQAVRPECDPQGANQHHSVDTTAWQKEVLIWLQGKSSSQLRKERERKA